MPKRDLGVDLEDKYEDVRKLSLSYLKFKDQNLGDILQDVYLTILTQNGGPSAHDPSKSALSNYVFMILRRVLVARRLHTAALKRGGSGTGTLEHEPVTRETFRGELHSVASPETSDSGMRALYLQELQARPSCPPELKRYIRLLALSTDSETLEEALELETAQMTALRRKLIAWLRFEGELSSDSLL